MLSKRCLDGRTARVKRALSANSVSLCFGHVTSRSVSRPNGMASGVCQIRATLGFFFDRESRTTAGVKELAKSLSIGKQGFGWETMFLIFDRYQCFRQETMQS